MYCDLHNVRNSSNKSLLDQGALSVRLRIRKKGKAVPVCRQVSEIVDVSEFDQFQIFSLRPVFSLVQ